MNSDDCGCDSGINLLTNNQPNNLNPIQVNRNANNRIMNNYQNNMNQVNNNNNLNNLIQGNDTNNQLDEIVEENNRLKDLKEANLTDSRSLFNLFLIILLCLAVNEMAKYFINQSIRLNKGTSARFLYYPIGIFVVLVLFNMF
jgi:Na+/glutamate symporter